MKPEKNIVHVAVAVIQDSNGKYLITKRSAHAHQGGLWEFPGGKLEQGESVYEALKREIYEEVGLTVKATSPLIRINHDYGDKLVLLDVCYVNNFSGEAVGKEGQELTWANPAELDQYDFPAANVSIIKALKLPERYMITGAFDNYNQLAGKVDAALEKGISLIQFRAHQLNSTDYINYAKKLFDLCVNRNCRILLNTPFTIYNEYHAHEFSHGIHLSTKELITFSGTDGSRPYMISASVHNKAELELVNKHNCDLAVISPVKETISHPGMPALGWKKFRALSERATIPVYALGGMTSTDIITAKQNGAQGISAIREFWL